MHKLAVVVAVCLMGCPLAASLADQINPPDVENGVRPRMTRVQQGRFDAIVGGYWSGKGRADVSRNTVRVIVEVTTEDGQQGMLQAMALRVRGQYFSGPGTLMGRPVMIFGRLDAARASRLTALVSDPHGNFCRLVGTNPADKGDPNWAAPPSGGSLGGSEPPRPGAGQGN
jgi:hypothetical protein